MLSLSDFDYVLPPELIAQTPAACRSASRLLHLDARGALHDRQFTDLLSLLRPHDLLVFNDTRVIKARLRGAKATGGKVEVLVERILPGNRALAHVRASKTPGPGMLLNLAGAFDATVIGRDGELFLLQFPSDILTLLDEHGATPLPPYITHAADAADDTRYQTVYAREPGAVAAPTAGLHFDEATLAKMEATGVERAFVTLHVGAGTFQPVRSASLADHVMHSEWYSVPPETVAAIARARAAGGRVIAVGTTSVRALESAALPEETIHAPGPTITTMHTSNPATSDPAGSIRTTAHPSTSSEVTIRTEPGDTRLFITPGFTFQVIDALITNFHLPQSTLLMLVSALAGTDAIRRAYAHAVAERYRFFSYGDAMFIEPATP